MKAKEYLRQLQRLDAVINQKIKESEDLKIKLSDVGSIDYSKEKVQTGFYKNAFFEKLIERRISLEEEINAEIDIFLDKKHEIINQIQSLKNTDYISLLYKRYVEFKRLEVISVEMKFSYNYIKHLHGYALKDFENKFLNSTPNNT